MIIRPVALSCWVFLSFTNVDISDVHISYEFPESLVVTRPTSADDPQPKGCLLSLDQGPVPNLVENAPSWVQGSIGFTSLLPGLQDEAVSPGLWFRWQISFHHWLLLPQLTPLHKSNSEYISGPGHLSTWTEHLIRFAGFFYICIQWILEFLNVWDFNCCFN